ncbi:MAG: hypothetical protein II822_10425 [Prevotella sp.]|nr:hypothetical protein [Prevotella sp.]
MTGRDITVTLTLNGTAIANTRIRSNDIQTQADTIEKASSNQQQWKEFIAGRKEWNLTVSYLVLASSQVSQLLYVGQTFGIIMKQGSTSLLTGTAIMQSVRQTATIGNLCQGSFSLKGTGALQ